MGDVRDVPAGAAETRYGEEERDGRRPSPRAVALILILVLLLCAVVTALDVWMDRGPDEIRFVTRNIGCLQCHSELIPATRMPSVHDPFRLQSCTTCHSTHGEEVERTVREGGWRSWRRVRTLLEWLPLRLVMVAAGSSAGEEGSGGGGRIISAETVREKGRDSELTSGPKELCWICHGDLGVKLGMRRQHAPFAGGHCTNCHDPHASDFRVLLKQSERDLCLTCHPIGPELARKQTHPPAAERHCTNCHDPHASEWKGILVKNQRDLCFICHPSVAPLSLKPVQHQPFLYDNCTGCHEPHGSDHEPLLIKDEPPLCYDCHPVIEKDFLRASRHPVDTPGFGCADCHDPHGADYAALLVAKDDRMCYECHMATIGVTYEDSRHRRTLCVSCHTPHGSDFAPILQAASPQVCLDCHPRYDEAYGHPIRPTYWDTAAEEPLTCTSTCHDPHGSASPAMIGVPYQVGRFGAANLCLSCHKTVGIEF